MEVPLERAKTGVTEIFLECPIRKSYDFYHFKGAMEVFGQKIWSQHAVWIHNVKVDALFRFIKVMVFLAGAEIDSLSPP